MKVPIVVDKKKKSRKENNYNYGNSDNSDDESKARPPKFISFSLLMDQKIPSDLQLRLRWWRMASWCRHWSKGL